MTFSPGDAIRFGWETFKGRPWFFIGAVAILLLASIAINIVSSAIDSATGGSLEEPSIAGSIVNYGLAVLLNMGAIAFFLPHTTAQTGCSSRRCGIRNPTGSSWGHRFWRR